MNRREALKLMAVGSLMLGMTDELMARPRSNAEQLCVGSVCFPRLWTQDEQTLPLRGAGRLTWWGFSVYTSAFYCDREAQTVEDVLGNRARRLVLHYHRSIKATDIARATEYWVKRNPRNDHAALEERLKTLYNLLQNVRNGDEYGMYYKPDVGTIIQLNQDKPSDPIPGEDFGRAFFGIWLSEVPLKEDLRDRLIFGDA
jgi:hypothetical protein